MKLSICRVGRHNVGTDTEAQQLRKRWRKVPVCKDERYFGLLIVRDFFIVSLKKGAYL